MPEAIGTAPRLSAAIVRRRLLVWKTTTEAAYVLSCNVIFAIVLPQ
jgi:hypothetical protein